VNASAVRVLYVVGGRGFRSDSMSRKCAGVVQSMRAEGATVKVISGGDLTPLPAPGEPLSQKIRPAVKFPFGSFLYHSVSETRDILHDRRLRRAVDDIISDFRPTLIWERSSRLHTSGVNSAVDHRIPFVLEWVDNLLELYGKSLLKPLARSDEKIKMHRAHRIVVPSSKLVELLSAEWKISPERFLVAINGVDAEEFSPCGPKCEAVREELRIGGETFVVGYIGSYAWYQNVELLVHAAHHLAKTNRIEGKLFLMVGDGPGRSACEDCVEKYSLRKYFHFMGAYPQGEIPKLLSVCDAAVLPDCLEIICPIKVQEYLSMALAVLVPDYEANREVVLDQETGVCFRPKDPSDLADKIDRLASDPTLAEALRANARQSVLQRFTWDKTWGAAFRAVAAQL